MISDQNPKSLWPSPLALLQGLLPFDKGRIGPDIVAGITLAALGIPEVMGYTRIIGTLVITGLYTLSLPVLIFAVFGSLTAPCGQRRFRNGGHCSAWIECSIIHC